MKNEWILEILDDLRGYARANGMGELAECLDDGVIVALATLRQPKRA